VCLRQTGRMAMQTLAFAESSHALGDARHDCVSSEASVYSVLGSRSHPRERRSACVSLRHAAAGVGDHLRRSPGGWGPSARRSVSGG
jgi:hypothetical protein